ncbi:MAG TPA: hypothetical protein VH208_14215 [Myxococcaceae bacterium]|nr:hypothetical protein [Myxococcaceae bacterium]
MSPDAPPDDPHDDADPLYGEGGDRGERGGLLPEFVRKMAVAGLGALFMTEEGLRGLAGQLKLPKEALQYIVSQAEKTKDDIGRVVSEELRRFLRSEQLREEFLKLLTGMTVEIKAEVRLVPDAEASPGDAAGPRVSVTDLSVRRGRRKRE